MTHIIIPITELLEEAIRAGNYEILSEAIFTGKQISLDEQDIEAKIDQHRQDVEWTEYNTDGYKQALKDLL